MKRAVVAVLVLMLLFSVQTGCKKDGRLDREDPVTLTLWHNYGGQMKDSMDAMVDEFNETVGSERGIIISVTSISSSNALHDKLVMIANGDAGAPEMPDIATTNPKTAVILAEKGLLTDLKSLFAQKELDAYIPRFLEEGTLETEHLYIFPTAKSTEVLFLNKTVFDRFAKDTGATFDDLSTFEGIAETADLYYQWSDSQTPGISGDGKAFFHADSLFNLTQIGCRQLGEDFLMEMDKRLDYTSPAFKRIWDFFFEAAVRGHFTAFDGYASDHFKTGEVICSVGSTAGVLFFDPVVTYPDNTMESMELMVLPYPVFSGGEKIALQRGAGMVVARTDERKAYAAAIFLKWFTSPENNLRFISTTGYLPVTKEAFGEIMTREIQGVKDRNIRSLLTTSVEMQADYDFYIPPSFEGIDVLQQEYSSRLIGLVSGSRAVYRELLKTTDEKTAYREASRYVLESLQK